MAGRLLPAQGSPADGASPLHGSWAEHKGACQQGFPCEGLLSTSWPLFSVFLNWVNCSSLACFQLGMFWSLHFLAFVDSLNALFHLPEKTHLCGNLIDLSFGFQIFVNGARVQMKLVKHHSHAGIAAAPTALKLANAVM